MFSTGQAALSRSISCPSRDRPNAVARVTDISKSATSINESIVSISIEKEEGLDAHLNPYGTSSDMESSTASESKLSSDEGSMFSILELERETEGCDKHMKLEQSYDPIDTDSLGREKCVDRQGFEAVEQVASSNEENRVSDNQEAVGSPGEQDNGSRDAIDGIYNIRFCGIIGSPLSDGPTKDSGALALTEENEQVVSSSNERGVSGLPVTDLEDDFLPGKCAQDSGDKDSVNVYNVRFCGILSTSPGDEPIDDRAVATTKEECLSDSTADPELQPQTESECDSSEMCDNIFNVKFNGMFMLSLNEPV